MKDVLEQLRIIIEEMLSGLFFICVKISFGIRELYKKIVNLLDTQHSWLIIIYFILFLVVLLF
jgi:hypothetical protein